MAVLPVLVLPVAVRLRFRNFFKSSVAYELTNLGGDFVAYAAKDAAPLNGVCLGGRIVEAPMQEMHGSRPRGTAFLGTVADGKDIIERSPHELLDRFRTMMRDIDANFRHHLHRFSIQTDRMRAGR